MKTYKNIFPKILEEENIREAILNSSLGKRNRADVLYTFNNFDKEIKHIQEILDNETFVPFQHPNCLIKDGSSKKERYIVKPTYNPEQIVHHAIMRQLIPILDKGDYKYNCGSIPYKGSAYGAKAIKQWIKEDYKNTKYIFKCDIHHFFQSIDLNILYNKLERIIKDRKLMRLIKRILDIQEKGLPLGYYTSQWFANYYLQALDHYIKEELHVKYYVRYMDDMVFFADSKQYLHFVKNKVEKYLQEELNLELKNNWQIFRFNYYNKKDKKWKGRALDFMGYKFYRHKTTMRKNILHRASHKAKQIKASKVTCHNASQMLSYMGWISQTDSYYFYKQYIKPNVKIKQLKQVVSKRSRREHERAKLKMEKYRQQFCT